MMRLARAGLIGAAAILLAIGAGSRVGAASRVSQEFLHFAGLPVAVGQVGPIARDNPREEPFACETQHTDLGQPVVDNQNGIGYPVTNGSGNVIGYSANCGAPTIVKYYYLPAGSAPDGALDIYDPANPPSPQDIATADIGDQHNVPVIIRYETGTINRFIYAIAVITPHPSTNLNRVDLSAWNHKLVFLFGGGVGIGYDQAAGGYALTYVKGRDGTLISPTAGEMNGRALLEDGYALASSTGTVTATTYNLRLMGETAMMVKKQFIGRYGRPQFTFAFGGSGGAIQQTIYAQDFPGLLDGLIPSHPYPDMITQINPVGDCELAEFYFDVSNAYYNGALNPLWFSWPNREFVEGMAGINGFQSGYAPPGGKIPWSPAQMGSDECIEGWYGLTPEVLNPQWPEINPNNLPESEMAGVHWDYYDDLKHIFGVNPHNGYAYNTFDNVGVQYGLLSLQRGEITPDEFLNINAGIGGWMKSWDMPAPGFPFESNPLLPDDFWSQSDAYDVASPGFTGIAPRTVADPKAMENAYRSGLVFMGAIDNPIINFMAYLEPQLNMHSSREVFAIRQRLIDARGNADNQVIWGLPGIASMSVYTKLAEQALDLETTWLTTGTRPADAMDACFDINGNLIAEGPHVWDGEMTGEMNGNPSDDPNPGPCTKQFPIYSSSRLLAGARISEMKFKCALKPVSQALTDGTYGSVTFTPGQVAYLEQIFPNGVCDYSQPDQGRPHMPLDELIKVIHNYVGE